MREPNEPQRYSINLLWVNYQTMEDPTYIYPTTEESELKTKLLNSIVKWAEKNPDADIILWHDCTNKDAINRTQTLLNTVHPSNKIKLKSIHELEYIKQNDQIINDLVPVYFKVDLLKLLILIQSIEIDGFDATIFSDLEVGDKIPNENNRMTKKELFGPEVDRQLENFGFLVGETK